MDLGKPDSFYKNRCKKLEKKGENITSTITPTTTTTQQKQVD